MGPGRELGRYRVVSELGRGGMGIVFRASDTVLRRQVALKVLWREEGDTAVYPAANLLREARAAAAISHPNAVSVYDIGDVDGTPYIAMELVEGRTLRTCVSDPSLSTGTRVRWLTDIARALAAAHVRGVVHRDVKPENILVREDGVVKVLDFGIARQIHPASTKAGAILSQTPGMPAGTLAYMAPEQIVGGPVDAAADQFAWGVVAFELLTTSRPWGAHEQGLRALGEIVWRDPVHVCTANPEVPRRFGEVVMRALSRDSSARFPSMSGLLASVEPLAPTHSVAHGNARAATGDETLHPTTEVITPREPSPLALPTAASVRGSGLPARIGGKYSPVRFIAKGGTSAVYEVEHMNTGQRWALKLLDRGVALDPVALDRFKREARVSTQVKSDHIVRVVDADVASELDDAPFLVMELLDGQTLEELTAGCPQPPGRVMNWMRQVARGLGRSHAVGIVHRDLKPGNLFLVRGLDEATAIKILDFGVAKVQGAGDGNTTASGTIVGTPQYIPPEQASGGLDSIGVASDVWALGMTTYRLLAGREYWEGDSVSKLLSLVLFAPVAPPSMRGLALGDGFDAWFLRSCAREPAQRFASVTDQINALALAVGLAMPDAPDDGLSASDSLRSLALGIPRTPPNAVDLAESGSAPGLVRPRRLGTVPIRAGVAMAAVLIAAAAFGGLARREGNAAPSAPRASGIMTPGPTPAPPPTMAPSGPSAVETPPATASASTIVRALAPAPARKVIFAAPEARTGTPKQQPARTAPVARMPAVNPYADPH